MEVNIDNLKFCIFKVFTNKIKKCYYLGTMKKMPVVSTDSKCLFCGGSVSFIDQSCSDRPSLGIGRCEGCNLVQVLDFSHISLDHYANDEYFPDDIKPMWDREAHWNINRIERLTRLLPNPKKRKVLDFGCGIGGFLKRADGSFASVVGYDLSVRLCEIHRRDGRKCFSRIEELPQDIDTLVLFHVLEHVERPWDLLRDLVRRFPGVDRVVLEVPNTGEALLSLFGNDAYSRNHYGADHVYYFTNATLRAVAERAGLRVLVNDQMQRYTLGNTFGWLADGHGGGQNKWTIFNDPTFHAAYEKVLTKAGIADSIFLICQPTKRMAP